MTYVNGATSVVGLFGYPVTHTLSPAMHNLEFEQLGLDCIYVPAEVAPENLERAVQGAVALGWRGYNITIPHKQAIMGLLDEVSPEAKRIGAVNTVLIHDGISTGHNTDVSGFVEDIQQDILLERSKICIVGAGGAARAVAVGVLDAGADQVFLCNRSEESALALSESLRLLYPDRDISWGLSAATTSRERVANCDIVVNTTPAGMGKDTQLPMDPSWLHSNHYLYDTIYVPTETRLMTAAKKAGGAVRGGLGMLARQGALSFKMWTGKEPSVDRMENTLRKLLALSGNS